jgi:hypothetical protein
LIRRFRCFRLFRAFCRRVRAFIHGTTRSTSGEAQNLTEQIRLLSDA